MHWLEFGAKQWIDIGGVILMTAEAAALVLYALAVKRNFDEARKLDTYSPFTNGQALRPSFVWPTLFLALFFAYLEFNYAALAALISALLDRYTLQYCKSLAKRHRSGRRGQ